MLVQGIKSRPVYEGFAIDPHAKRHIFALEGEGALSLLEQEPGPVVLSRGEILYTAGGSRPQEHFSTLAALGADQCWQAPTIDTLLFRLRGSLTNATMGTRLYVSGTEGFIGRAIQLGLDFGIDFRSIITEHRGSLARRVQCVHCKGITDNVTVTPFTCTHCGLTLLVRDHYSRRLAAFQGVNIDAEEPGTAPEPEELFS
jgi:dimethylamine monooxygenase subunit C